MLALEGKGLKVNVGKTKIMVSGTEGEITSSKIDPCVGNRNAGKLLFNL